MPFDRLHAYFRSKGFEPFAFQLLAWERTANGVHQLIQCPTGSGKTLAATGAMIEKFLANPQAEGVRLLYVTPLRAMTKDLERHVATNGLYLRSARGVSSLAALRLSARTHPD